MTIYKIIKIFLPILFMFGWVLQASAQEIINLRGKISGDTTAVGNIHIINLSMEQGTTSDAYGNFLIPVRKRDTLYFSSVQYENQQLIVTEKIFNERFMRVDLMIRSNELDEIQLSDIKLSGALEYDYDKIKTNPYIQYGTPYGGKKYTLNELKMITATTSAGGIIPLDLILNTLNGKIDMLEKALYNDKLTLATENAIDVLGEEYFTKTLSLPQEEIINFLYWCAEYPEFRSMAKQQNVLDLMQFCADHLQEFLDHREIQVKKED